MAFLQFHDKIMKMMDIHITIIAYFLTNTLNWDVI